MDLSKPIAGKPVYGTCTVCRIYLPLVECTACKENTCKRCAGKHFRKHLADARLAKTLLKMDPTIRL